MLNIGTRRARSISFSIEAKRVSVDGIVIENTEHFCHFRHSLVELRTVDWSISDPPTVRTAHPRVSGLPAHPPARLVRAVQSRHRPEPSQPRDRDRLWCALFVLPEPGIFDMSRCVVAAMRNRFAYETERCATTVRGWVARMPPCLSLSAWSQRKLRMTSAGSCAYCTCHVLKCGGCFSEARRECRLPRRQSGQEPSSRGRRIRVPCRS